MPFIRMDLDQAQSTIDTMRRTSDELQSILGSLCNRVSELMTTWEGASAEQFSVNFEIWSIQLNEKITELESMIHGLAAEKDQMINADSSSSFS